MLRAASWDVTLGDFPHFAEPSVGFGVGEGWRTKGKREKGGHPCWGGHRSFQVSDYLPPSPTGGGFVAFHASSETWCFVNKVREKKNDYWS